MTDGDIIRRLSELAARFGATDGQPWSTVGDFWPLLDRLREHGAVVVLKLDGGREPGTDPFVLVISGGPLDDDFVHVEADSAGEALRNGLSRFAAALAEA